MSARETSINVYHQIENEGLLSKMRLNVFRAIVNTAPCTSAEALSTIITADNVLTQSRARFTELRERGVIKEIGVRKCTITGRNAILWDVTDMLPIEPQKKSGRPQGFKKVVKYLIDVMEKNNLKEITLEQLKKSLNQ